jgi:hypothetical protein
LYLVTIGGHDGPYPDSLTADAATAMQLAETASRRHPGEVVKAWEAEHSELGFALLNQPLAEFRDGTRIDLGGLPPRRGLQSDSARSQPPCG